MRTTCRRIGATSEAGRRAARGQRAAPASPRRRARGPGGSFGSVIHEPQHTRPPALPDLRSRGAGFVRLHRLVRGSHLDMRPLPSEGRASRLALATRHGDDAPRASHRVTAQHNRIHRLRRDDPAGVVTPLYFDSGLSRLDDISSNLTARNFAAKSGASLCDQRQTARRRRRSCLGCCISSDFSQNYLETIHE